MASPGELTVRTGRVRRARRLASRAYRAETGEFLVEGPQAVREALTCTDSVLEVFATDQATQRYDQLAALAADRWTIAPAEVIDYIADATNPQGLVARCRSVIDEFDATSPPGTYVVVCADIRDPGNAGAVIRCADAAGADAVFFTADSVDPLNPKVVRSTAGSLFHLPVIVHRDTRDVLEALRAHHFQVFGADGAADTAIYDEKLDYTRPTAWLMGNEAWGLPDEIGALADQILAVPIYGRAESLNVATAAAVCLYAGAAVRATREALH